MIADHIAAAQGVHSDLRRRPFADDSLPSVPNDIPELRSAHVGQDPGQRVGRATRGIFLQAVMHFDHFQIAIRSENLRRLASQPE